MDKANMYWQTYLNLENELLELSKYIYITDTKTVFDKKVNAVKITEDKHQLETYSNYIADLLIRCCVEIESISKELYFDNGGSKYRGSNDLYFDTDCLAFLNERWELASKVVMVVASSFNLSKEENCVLTPLKKADMRSKALWAKAYQAVKHDRYNSLPLGNIEALLHSLGALYLLNIYSRDVKLPNTKFLDICKLDMSFGSKVFSLQMPNQNAINDVLNGIKGDELLRGDSSPYVAKYTNSYCKQVLAARDQYNDDLTKYIISQPEIKEPAFVEQLMRAKDIENINPQQRMIPLWELFKYRINKRIPATLPFETRKSLFVQSEEWRGKIRRINEHLSENELTPENIQSEIDHAAILYAIELDRSFSLKFMHTAFNEGYCEIVLDKGNVRYQ